MKSPKPRDRRGMSLVLAHPRETETERNQLETYVLSVLPMRHYCLLFFEPCWTKMQHTREAEAGQSSPSMLSLTAASRNC